MVTFSLCLSSVLVHVCVLISSDKDTSHIGLRAPQRTYFNLATFFYFPRHTLTCHQYYLQLRKDILEERMHCDDETSLLLASLALQAEYGDYQPEVGFILFSLGPVFH